MSKAESWGTPATCPGPLGACAAPSPAPRLSHTPQQVERPRRPVLGVCEMTQSRLASYSPGGAQLSPGLVFEGRAGLSLSLVSEQTWKEGGRVPLFSPDPRRPLSRAPLVSLRVTWGACLQGRCPDLT